MGFAVFIHYPPRNGPEPMDGFEENAFPEIVLGDFGNGAIEGDDPDIVLPGCWYEEGVIAEWHDTYSIFQVAKTLCLAHTGRQFEHPESCLSELSPFRKPSSYTS
jgi:hypothetical protein